MGRFGLKQKPSIGDRIGWPESVYTHADPSADEPVRYAGTVRSIDGNACWLNYPDGTHDPFIWRFAEGLNQRATVMQP